MKTKTEKELKTLEEEKFNKFIESGIIDDNEFQEYEICITEFDNHSSQNKSAGLFGFEDKQRHSGSADTQNQEKSK